MARKTTKSVRVVEATKDGKSITRQSRTMHYTHALVVLYRDIPAYTIPAGTYTVPAKRIRGRNIRSYETTLSRDSVHEAEKAGWGWVSFHQSREAADKAGRAYVSRSASNAAESKAIFGDHHPGLPSVVGYEIIDVVEI